MSIYATYYIYTGRNQDVLCLKRQVKHIAMPALILDGRAAREAMIPELKARIARLSRPPMLAIIQAGDLADSNAYIQAKRAFAEKIGAKSEYMRFPESVTWAEIIHAVEVCSADPKIDGIIVQLPLPAAIDRDAVIEAIDPRKDADALTSYRVRRWLEGGKGALLPATARGVKELLGYYKIGLFGKHVVVIGRSMLVGKPIAAWAVSENATVTICHSRTADFAEETRRADIVIVAAGKTDLIGPDHVRKGAVVIDVGINAVGGTEPKGGSAGRRLAGDVDFASVAPILGDSGAISPVPGGVGPMTVLGLFENLADLCDKM